MVVLIHRFCWRHRVVALWCGWEETGSLVQKSVGYQERGRDWSWLGRGRGDVKRWKSCASAIHVEDSVRQHHLHPVAQLRLMGLQTYWCRRRNGIHSVDLQPEAKLLYLLLVMFIYFFKIALQYVPTLQKMSGFFRLWFGEKKEKKNEISWNVFGDIFQKPLSKARLRRGRSWSALPRLAFGIHTDPLISLMLLEIKGLAHITKWDSKMLHCFAEMHCRSVLKRKWERDDKKWLGHKMCCYQPGSDQKQTKFLAEK